MIHTSPSLQNHVLYELVGLAGNNISVQVDVKSTEGGTSAIFNSTQINSAVKQLSPHTVLLFVTFKNLKSTI